MKLLTLLLALSVWAAPQKKSESTSKKTMSFDSQLVEGEVYRPDYSVVTGEAPGEGWGVLRLRTSFNDHARSDAEENKR